MCPVLPKHIFRGVYSPHVRTVIFLKGMKHCGQLALSHSLSRAETLCFDDSSLHYSVGDDQPGWHIMVVAQEQMAYVTLLYFGVVMLISV
jgi:hypothetical protein